MAKITLKYSNGKYLSENATIAPERVRSVDRRRLKEKPEKDFMVDLLGPKNYRKTVSRLRPRV